MEIKKNIGKRAQKFAAVCLGMNGNGKLKNGVYMFLPHNSTLGYLSNKIVHKGKKNTSIALAIYNINH